MKIMNLYSSGRKAVLSLKDDEYKKLNSWLGLWFDSGIGEEVIPADLVFQTKNKIFLIEDGCPISQYLGLLCVNEKVRDLILKVDVGAKFLELKAPGISFFLYRASKKEDPFSSGIEVLFDGTKRIRRPVFRDGQFPVLFQLPEKYEARWETMCNESFIDELRRSKFKGIAFYDYESRTEKVL